MIIGVRVEILGSGGAATIPRPGCRCRVCVEARAKGGRFARSGPSTFVHGPNILFDTPEESKFQLERAGIGEIAACFYSHWHPDHTMGRRVWETRNGDFRTWPREAKRPLVTDVYLPQQVATDFRTYLGGMAHLEFMRDRGWIRIHELGDGETVEIGAVTVRPFRLAEDYVYAFELTDGPRRLVVAMDELNGWSPPAALQGCDVAVLPMGICEFDLFTGERLIHRGPPGPRLRGDHRRDARDRGRARRRPGRAQSRRGDGLHLLRRPDSGSSSGCRPREATSGSPGTA